MNIIKPGSNCLGVYEAQETGVIVDACDYYRAVYQAARAARRYLLLTGWQFDSEVCLLRGEEARHAGEVRFLHFLEQLCSATPDLTVYILAWDFSVIFSMEREWFQHIIFNWTTNERIRFRFDNMHAVGATHHQKLVLIDGQLAFVGGMDICADRWDDRYHLAANPERCDANGPYGSYHDVQSYHTGPIVAELQALFEQRWINAGGEPLLLEPVPGRPFLDTSPLLPLNSARVAISRTQALSFQPEQNEILEIRSLFLDAIHSADELIYMENQYFSSQAIFKALLERMQSPDRPRLQIIMVLPDRLPFSEELFLGVPQMKMLSILQQVATTHGHRLGVYSSVCDKDGQRGMTFIHSKVLLVDDRFLTVGSANLTNRSLGLDTELNVSWEAEAGDVELARRIRLVRASLLAEHAGLFGQQEEQRFESLQGLCDHLDLLAEQPENRICRYAPDPALESSSWPEALDLIARVVDPLEKEFEALPTAQSGPLSRGLRILAQFISNL